MADVVDESFETLIQYLKEQRGFDFTGYKRPSLMRRVRRRMAMVGQTSFDDYLDFLAVNPDEFTALFNTILINVTGFFRDVDAWRYLQDEALPDVLRGREGRPIRAWSAGCASGEEAYTLAMVLAQEMEVDEFRDRVKIYATDVDEEALALARQATYSDQDARSVPPAYLERFFQKDGQRYTFRKEFRRSVIFGRNDLVRDAPISHVDILCCRNTLMYFNAETQAQILNRLHFSLAPDGLLFLGKAEMLLSHSTLFKPVDLRRRFFKRANPSVRDRRTLAAAQDGGSATDEFPFERVREEALLSVAVAQIVVDIDGRLALSSNRATQLFGLDPRDLGRPLQDLEISFRPVELRQHIADALRERRPVWVRDVIWNRTPSEALTFDVQVVPLTDDRGNLLGSMVIFNDVTSYKQLQTELEYANRQLETAYEEVQSTNEELETTNEELQSTVEELETTNEELQSTNEELETMNEELQSMNDELHLSNDGLRERQDEVDRLNDFMSAVLASLHAAVIVVDRDFKVMAWNTQSEDLWGLRADETVGRHLSNLDVGLPVAQLLPALKRQLVAGNPGSETMELSAVNRRGREVSLAVTIQRLAGSDDASGLVIVTDVK